jgi:hypothetical protein
LTINLLQTFNSLILILEDSTTLHFGKGFV